jgi:hypothetical protein
MIVGKRQDEVDQPRRESAGRGTARRRAGRGPGKACPVPHRGPQGTVSNPCF